MDSGPPLSLPDVELLPPAILTMSLSSDTEEDVNQEFESDRWFNRRFFNWCKVPSCGNVSELGMDCFALVLIVWLIVSLALMVGVFGPHIAWIGPNSSILVKANSIFVQSVKVEKLYDSKSGLELFGFYITPPLDVSVNWSQSRLLPLSQNSYKACLRCLFELPKNLP